ncbi:MAG: hypothetical protein LBJ43_03575 [Propionibacteriaceae bacterium]|jgi:hypothetical protein|nr:hypothetical protein [Propionibacteriaceae bacterium]
MDKQPEHYWGVTEVARRLEVKTGTISNTKLPPPDVMVGTTRGWRPESIEAWIPTRPGRGVGGGRPRKQRES